MNNIELYHWGIKGMKWGVRRYQNPDGSLTEAGKRRQAKIRSKNLEKARAAKAAKQAAREEVLEKSEGKSSQSKQQKTVKKQSAEASNGEKTKRKEFYQKEKYIFAFCYFGTKNYTDNYSYKKKQLAKKGM